MNSLSRGEAYGVLELPIGCFYILLTLRVAPNFSL